MKIKKQAFAHGCFYMREALDNAQHDYAQHAHVFQILPHNTNHVESRLYINLAIPASALQTMPRSATALI